MSLEMPAIQPARLKKQVSELVSLFHQPTAFVRQLHMLLDLYSDHTHRKGQAGRTTSLVSVYKAPPPVMRQVWLELFPMIQHYPSEILALFDALWREPNHDMQLLAARLLGQAPVKPPEPLLERLQTWVEEGMESRSMDELFNLSLVNLVRDAPEKLLDLLASWLNSGDKLTQQAGFRALRTVVDQSNSTRLPAIYRLIAPFLRVAPSHLRPDILVVVSSLIACSPAETSYLLRQNLGAPDNPDTAWIIRQVIHEFPEETRAGLKQAMKEARK
jgi:hypothetical protein